MNIQHKNTTLFVSEVKELTAASARAFKKEVKSSMKPETQNIDLDASELSFIDSSGLGALISLQKVTKELNGQFRIISPGKHIIQIIELTHLHRILEIVL